MHLTIKSISVKNIRSIRNSGKIAIKPITILAGRNSSGKSTFARLFPLLKQTALADKKHAILWYGSTVDFGSFETTVHLNKKDACIEFCIDVEISEGLQSSIYEVKITQQNDEYVGDYTPYLSLKSKDYSLEIFSDNFDMITKVIINNFDFPILIEELPYLSYASLIPSPIHNDSILNSYINKKYGSNLSNSSWKTIRRLEIFANGSPLLEPASSTKTTIDSIFKNNSNIPELETFSTEEFYNIAKANKLLNYLNRQFSEYFSNLIYVEPVRATAHRYKREQQLDANSIDPSGNNIYEFLYGKRDHLEEFNAWLRDNFKFTIKIESKNDHISIKIKESNSRIYTNIADAGFGYSQSLPILAQIWLGTFASKWGKALNTMVIEQPELHLHPAFQSQLADVFVQFTSGKEDKNLNLIIETHSEHIIKRLGVLVSEGSISNKDIQILVFEKTKSGHTRIRKSFFDIDGILTNWPVGFFIP